MCRPHLDEANAQILAIRERQKAERRANWLCERCGKRPPKAFGMASCNVCLAQERARYQRRQDERGKKPRQKTRL